MTRTTRLVAVAAGLAAGVLALAGCSPAGGTSPADRAAASSPATGPATFSESDVEFARGMIVHHQGALDMARLVDGRTQDQRIRDLADRIEAGQEPEITTMTGWLEAWGRLAAAAKSDDMGGMEMGHEDTAALVSASGAKFDRMWLEAMIYHHTGAVEMADTEISSGRNPDAITLAARIADSQSLEIQEMQAILDELGG